MTTRDFELIARTLASYRRIAISDVDPAMMLECLAKDLADNIKRENPRFNRDVFLAASGSRS